MPGAFRRRDVDFNSLVYDPHGITNEIALNHRHARDVHAGTDFKFPQVFLTNDHVPLDLCSAERMLLMWAFMMIGENISLTPQQD